MASTSEELFAAIEAGDVAGVRVMLDEDPSLATARDAEGVSALMRARYRFDRGLIEALQSRVREMDLFEAASAGDLDRLAELLAYDPASVDARSADGFTALHFAAFFGRPEAARLLVNHAADVDARGTGWMTGTAAAFGGERRATPRSSACCWRPAPIRTRGSRAGGRRCTRRRATATSRASRCCSPREPMRRAANDEGTSVLEMAQGSGDVATAATVAAALDR